MPQRPFTNFNGSERGGILGFVRGLSQHWDSGV